MSRVLVPSTQRNALSLLLGRDPEALAALVAYLQDAESALVAGQAPDKVSEILGTSTAQAKEVLLTLSSMHAFQRQGAIGLDDIIEGIQGDSDLKDVAPAVAWAEFREFLKEVFEVDAIAVFTDSLRSRHGCANFFCSASIATDFRPIFDSAAERIVAGLVIHNLELAYHQSGDREPQKVLVSLKKKDAEALRDMLESALKEGEIVHRFAEDGKVALLGEEP